MSSAGRDRKTLGALLVAIGLGIYLLRDGHLHGLSVLVILGVVFLVAYFASRAFGLLIPACVLLGLGLGRMFAGGLSGIADPERFGLGAGFLAIYAIQRLYQGRAHWWPLIPGGLLVLSAFEQAERVSRFLFENWPLGLVAVGAFILLAPLVRRQRD